MKTVLMLQGERNNLVAEAQAITELAVIEARELAKDETARLDEILGVGESPGLIAAKDVEIVRAQKLDVLAKQNIDARAVANNLFKTGDEASPAEKKIILPATAKRKVKHFASAEDAYSVGQFVMASMFGSAKAREWCSEHGMAIKAAHSTFDNEKGGYLVPEIMETTIIRLVEERGVFRSRGFVYPMGSDAVTIPRRASGFTVYYPGEGEVITQSDLRLNQIKLMAKKAAVMCVISTELDEDAVSSLASLITEEIAYAFANAEDMEGFNGDGTSAFGGTIGLKSALLAGSISTAVAGNVNVGTIDLMDFRSAIGKLPRFNGISPVFYMHSTVYHEAAARLMDAAGGNTSANIAGGVAEQFLGYPVQFVQTMPSVSEIGVSTNYAYFGDLGMASTMGTRRGVTIATDSSVLFMSDQIAIRGTARYDINIHERGTATTAGPIVALRTAAT